MKVDDSEIYEKTIIRHVYTDEEVNNNICLWPDKGFFYCFECGLSLEYDPRKSHLEGSQRYYTSTDKDGVRKTVILCLDCLIEKFLFEVV